MQVCYLKGMECLEFNPMMANPSPWGDLAPQTSRSRKHKCPSMKVCDTNMAQVLRLCCCCTARNKASEPLHVHMTLIQTFSKYKLPKCYLMGTWIIGNATIRAVNRKGMIFQTNAYRICLSGKSDIRKVLLNDLQRRLEQWKIQIGV